MNCPKCNSCKGYHTKGSFTQYYDADGQAYGYEYGGETHIAYCNTCGAAVRLIEIISNSQEKNNGKNT